MKHPTRNYLKNYLAAMLSQKVYIFLITNESLTTMMDFMVDESLAYLAWGSC